MKKLKRKNYSCSWYDCQFSDGNLYEKNKEKQIVAVLEWWPDSQMEISMKKLKKKIVAVVGMTVGLSNGDFYKKFKEKIL